MTAKIVVSKSGINQIICQRIPDRRTGLRHWKHASPCTLESLWRRTQWRI